MRDGSGKLSPEIPSKVLPDAGWKPQTQQTETTWGWQYHVLGGAVGRERLSERNIPCLRLPVLCNDHLPRAIEKWSNTQKCCTCVAYENVSVTFCIMWCEVCVGYCNLGKRNKNSELRWCHLSQLLHVLSTEHPRVLLRSLACPLQVSHFGFGRSWGNACR